METKQKNQTDLNQYVEAWQGHVKSLDRLRWNLSKNEGERLDKIQEDLRDLIACAVKDLSNRRQPQEKKEED